MTNPQPARRVTLKDIGRAVGLSHGAVSLALRNSSQVSKASCELVQSTAREMGYRPNPMAAGLAHFKRGSRSVPLQAALAWLNCWAEPEKLRSYREFDLYWQGAAKAAEKLGFRLEEFRVNSEMTSSRVENILRTRNVQGILIPPGLNEGLKGFCWEHFSMVYLGRPARELAAHAVTSDQMANTLLAYERIAEKGYKRIGFVGSSWRTRFFGAGYLWAVYSGKSPQVEGSDHLQLPPLFFSYDGDEQKDGQEGAFLAWFKKTKPDAILYDGGNVPKWLENAGCRVPDDIGLAATSVLDGQVEAGIYQNPEEIGRVSVLVLMSLIYDGDYGTPALPREILIKGNWVDGPSLPRRR